MMRRLLAAALLFLPLTCAWAAKEYLFPQIGNTPATGWHSTLAGAASERCAQDIAILGGGGWTCTPQLQEDPYPSSPYATFAYNNSSTGQYISYGQAASVRCEGNVGTMPTCEAPNTCQGGSMASSGYFDYGTASSGQPVLLGCHSGCEVVFDGTSPAGSAIVSGVRHFYAQGSYYRTGESCSGGANPGTAASALPSDSCAAGQGTATMNGRTVCVDQNTGQQTEGSQRPTTTTTSTSTNGDGSTTTTETTRHGDGSTTTTTTTTGSDGTVTTRRTWSGPAGSDADPNAGGEGTSGEEDPCADNPSASGCGGTPTPVGDPRAPGERTVADALGDFRDGMMGSPFGSAVSNFFTLNVGGSCPTWTLTLDWPINGTVTLDFYCSTYAAAMLLAARLILLLVASWYAVRIMLEN